MIETILTAIVTFIATSIDEIPVLFMLYASNKGKTKIITFSYFLGAFTLVGIGLLGSLGLGLIAPQWLLGLFGLVPLFLGIKILIRGEDDEDEAEGVKRSLKKYNVLGTQIFAITLGLGADDLAVYIPLFTTFTGWEVLLVILTFALAISIICRISYMLTSIQALTEFIEEYERFIIGILFSAIGIYIMYKCGTFAYFLTI